MLSAVEGQAFGELADLAGANAAEKRAVAWSGTFAWSRERYDTVVRFANGC